MVFRSPSILSATLPQTTCHAFLIEEHAEYVFGELFEMSKEKIASLEEAEVL